MTVKEFKEALESYPDDLDVYMPSIPGSGRFGMYAKVTTIRELVQTNDPVGFGYYLIDKKAGEKCLCLNTAGID